MLSRSIMAARLMRNPLGGRKAVPFPWRELAELTTTHRRDGDAGVRRVHRVRFDLKAVWQAHSYAAARERLFASRSDPPMRLEGNLRLPKGGRVPRSAPERAPIPKVCGGAPCGRLALCQHAKRSASRRRSTAGTNPAASTRLLCARRAARPDLSVVPC